MTVIELGHKLNEMYESGVGTKQVAMIHLFGVLFVDEILNSGATNKEIIKAAGMKESYHSELAKGRKLSQFVTTKPEYIKRFKG